MSLYYSVQTRGFSRSQHMYFSKDDTYTTNIGSHRRSVSNSTSTSIDEVATLSYHIAKILEHSCKMNDPVMKSPEPWEPEAYFYSCGQHDFSLKEYLDYVIYQTNCSPSVYVMGLIYMMRAQQANPKFRICTMNVHRLFASCIVIAAKYIEFAVMLNSDFAIACGIDKVANFNRLELIMLDTLRYDLKCKPLAVKFLYRNLICEILYDPCKI